MDYEIHPLAAELPPLPPAEYAAFAEDIRANGLKVPVTMHEGKILDGRNRALACEQFGLELRTEQLPKGTDPLLFVIQHNVLRRHLTPSERVSAISQLKSLWAELTVTAKASMVRKPLAQSGDCGKPSGTVAAQTASMAGVSEVTMRRMRAIEKADPEAAKKIGKDGVTVNGEYDRLKAAGKVGKAAPRQPAASKPTPTKKEVNQAVDAQFTETLGKFFSMLRSFESGLSQLSLDVRDIPTLNAQDRSNYLGAALSLQSKLSTLIRKLQGE